MGPESLGRYQLIRHLATGGMARVYLGRATGPGGFARHVVLKALAASRRDDEAYVSMFLDEARLVATLHHQNIAQVFEVGCADDGTYYLAMEYVHGETVRALLDAALRRNVKLPLEVGLSIACAAAAGLHHAHERRNVDGIPLGIVHRDVSPSNVILGFDGSIKLIDFGIASATVRATCTPSGFIKGKTGYMAPEQARGYKVDRRSDVFALGVLLYELTTGEAAFHAESQFEAMRKTLLGEVRPPSLLVAGYPQALEDVVMTALEVDPDDRFQDADAMRCAVEHAARELGLTLGAGPVMRVLGELFQLRPEPWLARLAPSLEEDPTVPFMTESEPMRRVKATPSPPPRLGRGSSIALQPMASRPPPAPFPGFAAADADIDPNDLTTQPFERDLPLPLPAVDALTPISPPVAASVTDIAAPAAVATWRASEMSPSAARDAALIANEMPPRAMPRSTTPVMPSTPFAAPPFAAPLRFASLIARPGRPWARPAVIAAATLAVSAGVILSMLVLRDRAAPSSPPIASPPVAHPAAPMAPSPVAAPTPPPAPLAPPAPPRAPVAAPSVVVGPVVANPPVASPAVDEPDTIALHVTTTPPGATVVLDGVRLGVTPFDARVPARPEAWLKVRMHDHIAVRTRVTLDHDVQWDVPLRPLAAAR